MSKLIAKSKRPEAERAAEWYAVKIEDCIMVRKAVKAAFQKVDFFGSDVMGKRKDGSVVYVQVTTGQHSAVTARRRKLEKVPWHESETIILLRLVETQDPFSKKRKLWWFKVFIYDYDPLMDDGELKNMSFRVWKTDDDVPVPKNWFTKWREDE